MLTPRPRKEPAPVTLESLPYKFRMALVKLMADNYIDVEAAFDKAAVLLDMNGKAFKDAVSKEANSIYKSRHMKEMNNARNTIQRKADARILEQYQEAYDERYLQRKQDNQIYYYCKVCSKMMYIVPNSESHQAVVNYMHEHGWGHTKCHERQRK